MAEVHAKRTKGEVWFAYDGDCPICTVAAEALQIRDAVGTLHLVNAREDRSHPLIREINERGFDLDEGMVIKYGGNCYHGEEALRMMALLGSSNGWFNRANALLIRSPSIANICYPLMRGSRSLLLRLMGVGKIRNLQHRTAARQPIFQPVFGSDWCKLPKVMRDHYAVCPNSNDMVVVKGVLDIKVSPFVGLMSRLSRMLVSRSGDKIPVTVIFTSGKDSADFVYDRIFHYPDGDERFLSRMTHVGGDELIEFIGFGIGWKTAFKWDGSKVILSHCGYVWRIFGVHIPIPLSLIIGRGEAEEVPIADNEFEMWAHARHPWFGNSFAYSGPFEVVEVKCDEAF